MGGGVNRARCRVHRAWPIRPQTHPRLLDGQPAWPDDGRPRRRWCVGRNVPFADARFFQGTALSRRGLDHPRLSQGTGHSQNGWLGQADAGDHDRLPLRHPRAGGVPVHERLFQQRRNPRRCLGHESTGLLDRRRRLTADSGLHDTPMHVRVSRRASRRAHAAREPAHHDGAAGHSRPLRAWPRRLGQG